MNIRVIEVPGTDDLELHIGDKFCASWHLERNVLRAINNTFINRYVVQDMLSKAFEAGKEARSEEMRKLLRL